MDRLTAFGLFAVTAMLVMYALERRSPWFILGFAGSCALGSAYGFLQGAWPFGVVEAIWAGVALQRWWVARKGPDFSVGNRLPQSNWPVSPREAAGAPLPGDHSEQPAAPG